jgi:hypothetical protein
MLRTFDDNRSQAKGSGAKPVLKPAKTWQQGAGNHRAYVQAVRDRLDEAQAASRCGSSPPAEHSRS